MAVLTVYPTPDDPPDGETEERLAAEHNRNWCAKKHRMHWQEKKRKGYLTYWCPVCSEWR